MVLPCFFVGKEESVTQQGKERFPESFHYREMLHICRHNALGIFGMSNCHHGRIAPPEHKWGISINCTRIRKDEKQFLSEKHGLQASQTIPRSVLSPHGDRA
jgi:hypothetical protein